MTNVVEVRVGLHCDECIKKILKAIKKIEELNKVTVTGNITTEQVIGALQKIRKNASPWEQPQSNS